MPLRFTMSLTSTLPLSTLRRLDNNLQRHTRGALFLAVAFVDQYCLYNIDRRGFKLTRTEVALGWLVGNALETERRLARADLLNLEEDVKKRIDHPRYTLTIQQAHLQRKGLSCLDLDRHRLTCCAT